MRQKVVLGENGLNCYPADMGELWWYEEPGGLSFYGNRGRVGLLTWRKLEAALRRKKAAKAVRK